MVADGKLLGVYGLKLILRRPGGAGLGGHARGGGQLDLGAVGGGPVLLAHGVGDHCVLDADDAGRVVGVVGGDGEARRLGVELGLDALGVGVGPLAGEAAPYVVVVREAGGAGGVAVGRVDVGVALVRHGHELVGDGEVEVARVEAVVLGIVVVVPRAVNLVPLAVELDGVPGVAVVGVAGLGILDAGRVEQLDVGVGVGLAGARVAREGRLGACPGEGVVILELVEQPIVQVEGHGVLAAVGFGAGLGDGAVHDGRDARVGVVRHGHVGARVQGLVGLLAHVHDVELVEVGARGRHGEGEVLALAHVGVGGVLTARGVGHAGVVRLARAGIGGRGHVVLVAAAAAGGAHVEGRGLAEDGVVPLDGYGERAARR